MENTEIIEVRSLYNCDRSKYVGVFPTESDYDRVINHDCDVFLSGRKIISFRKRAVPALARGSGNGAWEFFREASREVYGTQRGLVAGSEFTSRPDTRLTAGQVEFFTKSSKGLVTTLEQAKEILGRSEDLTTKTIKIKWVKRAFPELREPCRILESRLRDKSLPKHEILETREERRKLLWSWFEPWLIDVWLPASDKAAVTKVAVGQFISTQQNFNHCHSNVLGAVDRGARFPFGRLSLTTQRHFGKFTEFSGVYESMDLAFKEQFPETWQRIHSIISNVKDPSYNLFGTAFTSITLNYNFRTAFHVDKNNIKGGLAALTAMTRGNYEGHHLVFPEVRLAFDIRDGDVIIADTQNLLHGNTDMNKLSDDAERVSMVFYSREKVVHLESLECERCRKDFVKFSLSHLPERGKGHRDWTGVWPGMWSSQEWLDFKKEKSFEFCSNSNWMLSSPFRNKETGEIRLLVKPTNRDWGHLEIYEA